MDYKGYNGTISIQADAITITHTGFVAKAGGLATDEERRIPLAAISDVGFKDATRTVNGSLSLGLGGEQAAAHKATETPSNPNAILFRHRDAAAFRELHDWLVKVVAYNRASGVDAASVGFDIAEPTRLERMADAQQGREAELEAKKTQRLEREAEAEQKREAELEDQRAELLERLAIALRKRAAILKEKSDRASLATQPRDVKAPLIAEEIQPKPKMSRGKKVALSSRCYFCCTHDFRSHAW